MVLFALSFEDQVEKYGAYVGIAAFFGLAVLSLLYFSQARELKRLREWAERAPERARETEQRAVAQATASVARRVPAMPGAQTQGGIVPPRRLAEMPAPAAAGAAAAAAGAGQATEVAEPAEADPATNGNVPKPPFGPGGTVPAGPIPSNGTAPPAVASANGAAAPAVDEEEGAPDGSPDAPAEPETAPADPQETQPAGFEALQEDTGETEAPAPGEIPPATAVPRATPAQRVGVTPTPAPMPLQQTRPSATPRGAGGRAGTPAGRRPVAKPPREGRSAGTIALLVGLAVLILGGGTYIGSQVLGGDDAPTPPNQAAPPPTESPDTSGDGNGGGNGGGGGGGQARPPAETNVAVLNGTTSDGLASGISDRLAEEGYQRGTVQTNNDQAIQESVVFFADGFKPTASKVAQRLSIDSVQPMTGETQGLAPDADVVVLAGADQAP